jgi:hypothetical protein
MVSISLVNTIIMSGKNQIKNFNLKDKDRKYSSNFNVF